MYNLQEKSINRTKEKTKNFHIFKQKQEKHNDNEMVIIIYYCYNKNVILF